MFKLLIQLEQLPNWEVHGVDLRLMNRCFGNAPRFSRRTNQAGGRLLRGDRLFHVSYREYGRPDDRYGL